MFTFFKNTRIIKQTGHLIPTHTRSMHTMISRFNLTPTLSSSSIHKGQSIYGKLVKIEVSAKTAQEQLQKSIFDIIKEHRRCLFISTNKTLRMSHPDSLVEFHVGHTSTFITDAEGEIECSISKRPNTAKVLDVRNCIPDSRFKNQQRSIRLFEPLYTSVEEDFKLYLEKARRIPYYPLYLHIVPMTPDLPIDSQAFKDNVEVIKEYDQCYSLFSSVHPNGHYIAADNCISAAERAIFGTGIRTAQDMFCQDATMNFMRRLLNRQPKKSLDSYLSVVDESGFNEGIEPPPVCEDNYRASFTC